LHIRRLFSYTDARVQPSKDSVLRLHDPLQEVRREHSRAGTHNTDVFNDEYYEINSTRLAPLYNISPESIQPVVRLDHDTGERVLALMKWGLLPYWSKTAKAAFSSINARSDKLESSGAWRAPWKHRRCLIPANFFFEWEPLTKSEWGGNGSVCFHRNLEVPTMHCIYERTVQLKERFASREYHKLLPGGGSCLPGLFDSVCQSRSCVELSSIRTGSDEVRIAKLADSA
jgi:hypothetical protein